MYLPGVGCERIGEDLQNVSIITLSPLTRYHLFHVPLPSFPPPSYPWPWLKWEISSVANQPEERYQINSPHIDCE